MSTRAHWLPPVTAAAAVAVCAGLWAQPELVSTNPEEELRRQIAELQTESGLARPAGLIDPLSALALVYEEAGDHALATATLEEARHVARIHNGLTSAEEALLLRQQIRSEKALGLHERAWDLEQDMVTIARHHHGDIRMLPIFSELAEDRLAAIEKVRTGERPPMIYAGCYNGAPLPPYDYTRDAHWRTASAANSGSLTSPCIGGINQRLIYDLRGEILVFYADAIETILRTGDYSSQELRQLEKAALRVRYGRGGRTVILLGESDGSFTNCSGGNLDDYLALEILDSCLAPVGRLNGFVVASVGNSAALIRLISYEIRSAAPAAARLGALAELADHLVLGVPIERRRLDLPGLAHAFYERAYRELQQGGDIQAASEMFEPELPITIPAYIPNPFAFAATSSSRNIDVSFDVTKYGFGEKVEILETSRGATRAEERDLIRLIESTSFRPRVVDGKLADAAPVVVRYQLDR